MLHALAAILVLLGAMVRSQPEESAPRQTERPPRMVLAFYYPWYGTPDGPGGKGHGGKFVHWEGVDEGAKAIANSTNFPAIGVYDSHDPKVIDRHCRDARFAGIDAFIISWWGKGSFEDEAVTAILGACQANGMKACIYYEQLAKPGTPESVAVEFADLIKRYGEHPAYLKVTRGEADRPVFFVYARALHQLGLKKWKSAVEELASRATPRACLIADDFSAESLEIFDGAHSYAPMADLNGAVKKGETPEQWARRAMAWWATHPRTLGRISTITVFPGYDDLKIRTPGMKVDRDGGRLYEMLWREAVAADPDWILITSFNEWHEGSEIEPSVEDGDRYLKLTAMWASTFKSPDGKGRRTGISEGR